MEKKGDGNIGREAGVSGCVVGGSKFPEDVVVEVSEVVKMLKGKEGGRMIASSFIIRRKGLNFIFPVCLSITVTDFFFSFSIFF